MPEAPAIHCRRLGAETIGALQDCIRRTYGSSYPFQWFYDRTAVEKLLEEGRLLTVVAQNEEGRVVGTVGVLLTSPHNRDGDYSADSIAAMVDEDYRGHDVLMQLGPELFAAFKEYALVGIHLYALALHDVVQKRSLEKGRSAITGMLPAYFARGVHVGGFESGGSYRIGAVALFQSVFQNAPQRSVYLPEPYAGVLRGIYADLPLPRAFADSTQEDRSWSALPDRSSCRLEVQAANREAKLRVLRVGGDLGSRLAELRAQGAEQELQVLYVDLALDDGAIEHAVGVANGAGFSFGALIPERYQTDWLRLQFYEAADVSLDAMVVATEGGQKLLRFVGADRSRVEGRA